jgi:hypothetical protein
MTTWHKGPPPSIGWWPASWSRSPKILRWWDGKQWSMAVDDGMDAQTAEECAEVACSVYPHEIEWTDRPADWPARSRT